MLIAGLGNPVRKYGGTRHNAGFWFVDELAARYSVSLAHESRFEAMVGTYVEAGVRVMLVQPATYMNHSGRAIGAISRYYRVPAEQILVAHDELDFDPGLVRLKRGGGHGGHNGVRDTIACLGSRDFLRLRIGIGHPGHRDDVMNYVLAAPSSDDRQRILGALGLAADRCADLVAGEVERAMNLLHAAC